MVALFRFSLNGNDVKAAARGTIEWGNIGGVAAIVAVVVAGGTTIGNVAGRARQAGVIALATAGAVAAIFVSVGIFTATLSTPIASAQSANPFVAFAQSFLASPVPSLLSVDGRKYAADFENEGERRARNPSPSPARDHRIENVVVFVMESTPAKALHIFGAQNDVTPRLTEYGQAAQLFTSIYAHTPATNYSLFALLASIYPEISYYGMTSTHPFLKFDSLPNVLKENGFRTGMFWSGDKRFQRFDEFARNKGFDVFQDFRERDCNEVFAASTEGTKYMDYGSDSCTVDSMLSWIAQDPSKPFLAIMATAATHYPYKTGRPEEALTEEPLHNRFLNALKVTDEAFGELMDGLRESGKLDSTLVVVLGDHGEAFGEHGQWVHATAIYDENVHIPLVLINAQLFNGSRSNTLGGVVDVAPTILDILGIATPDQWQGRSLFAADRSPRVYFFSPWNGFLLGYREGQRSVLLNASTGNVEVYDLEKDPNEKTNIRSSINSTSEELIAPLAYLVQSQNKLIASMVASQETPKTECKLASIEFTAGGTEFHGKPIVELIVDGRTVGQIEIQGVQSTHSDSKGIQQEVAEATTRARSYAVTVPEQQLPKEIELRFANDLWMDGEENGDRNVVITDLSVNGHRLPANQMSVAEGNDALLNLAGATLFKNAMIKFVGPFLPGCLTSAAQ